MNTTNHFQTALEASGLNAPDVIVDDGRIHRFSADGKRSNKNGWYVLFPDGVASGSFGNWATGETQSWCSVDKATLTADQRAQFQARRHEAMAVRDAAQQSEHDEAAKLANVILSACTPIDGSFWHGYLDAKGIGSHGALLIEARQAHQLCKRLSPELTGPLLVIPMRNPAGYLRSLQFITEAGVKRPLTGGQKRGCYFTMGVPKKMIIICEGFATGASVRAATGQAVAVAFDTGNLALVTTALHRKYPDLTLIVAADDDWRTEGNPGLHYAKFAALSVGGFVVKPQFPAGRPPKATDFNDLAALAGMDAVRACFAEIEELS